MCSKLRFIDARLTGFFSIVLVGAICSTSTTVAGEKLDSPKRQEQENAARMACLDGDFTKGVAILTKLFVETKNVTYIFNQGRCLEQNRQYEEAIARFQEYLRAGRKNLGAGDKAEAEQRISDCKEMLAQARAAQTSPVTPPPPSPVIAPPPPAPAPSPVITQPSQADPPSSDGSGLRIAGIVTASVGVAAVGAGVLASMKANGIVDDMYRVDDGYKKESDRKTWATLTWAGYGVGAACIVTGAILYTVGLKSKSGSDSTVAFVPSVGNGFAGATFSGAF